MIWWILLIAFALIIAPVMWILPSPAQRRQADMREVARKLGLQVRVGQRPASHRQRVRKEDTGQGVCYAALLRRPRDQQVCAWQWWPADEPPRLPDNTVVPDWDRLKVLIDESGLKIDLLDYSHTGFAVWWRENGDPQTVQVLAGFVSQCLDLLQVPDAQRTHRIEL